MVGPDNYLDINGTRMHYIDEGEGDPILMLHGNPTWSYFYRNLVKGLSKTNRVIVPDHIGMGLSDKPQNAAYSLDFHIKNLELLIEHLHLKNIILTVHDWGGAIGFGYVVNHLENVKKIVILNSTAFYDAKIPLRIKVCCGAFSKLLTQRLNLFAKAATFMSTTKKLAPETKQGYLLPYNSFSDRIGIYTFLKDIPIKPEQKTRHLLDSIEARLHEITSDILILWGKKDFCFTEHYFNRWKEFFPSAKARLYENAGHYILEDVPDEVLKEIGEFVQ